MKSPLLFPKPSRRTMLTAAATATVAASGLPVLAADPPASSVPENFPQQSIPLVREIVSAAHTNVERVRELLTARPALANASWDWGFGDWETALGAASHMGRRDIAEVLLTHGATPTLFSAAMMGQLDLVKAMLAARPGLERNLGAHGISLLAHAKAGGAQATEVFQYLEALGTAGGPKTEAIAEEDLAKLAGEYVYGSGTNEKFVIQQKGKMISLARNGWAPRPLHHIGGKVFRPAGAGAVRVEFQDPPSMLTIRDGDLVFQAKRR